MQSARHQLVTLIDHGLIEPNNIEAALRETGVRPSSHSWRQFVERTLTWFGVLALAIALVFFIAFNWTEMGRYAKFALVQIVMVLAILAYVKWPSKPVLSPALLVGATIALGALMAFYGQTYQTGADPWTLFFGWAVLMLPWALVGSAPVLWLIFLGLINVALVLFFSTFGVIPFIDSTSERIFVWAIVAINGLALLIWECVIGKQSGASRYGPRVVALATLGALGVRTVTAIFDNEWIVLAIFLLLMAGGFFIYRYRIRDLFVLAVGCLSTIIVGTSLVIRMLSNALAEAGGLLLIALVIMASGASAAIWLRQVHQEFDRE